VQQNKESQIKRKATLPCAVTEFCCCCRSVPLRPATAGTEQVRGSSQQVTISELKFNDAVGFALWFTRHVTTAYVRPVTVTLTVTFDPLLRSQRSSAVAVAVGGRQGPVTRPWL